MNKMPVYKFYYDYMQSKYGSKVKLCRMDTGRLVYEKEI